MFKVMFKFLRLYKKPSLLILLICSGIISLLINFTYSFNLSISNEQMIARKSLKSLERFPQGLVLLSSKPWNETSMTQKEKNIIINWLDGNLKSNTLIELIDQNLIINHKMDKGFNFTSILQKVFYIPDNKIISINSDFNNHLITFTLGKT